MPEQTSGPSAKPSGALGPLLAPYAVVAILPEAGSTAAALAGLEAVGSILPSASLRAVHIEVDPYRLVADDEEISLQLLREKREGTSSERAAAVERVFTDWARTSPAASRVKWERLVGAEESTAVEIVRDCDLCIIGRPRNMDGQDALHGALFSHHLLLVVPPGLRALPHDFCRRIAVGWKPVKQVDQAMLLALPFLRHAEEVTLVTVDQPAGSYAHDHVLRLVQGLGVKPELRMARSSGRSVAATLAAEALAVNASVLVAGAYRHGQLIEELFGGVTQELLEESQLPVFMAH